MSALSAAASNEDGDIISALREKLGRAHALCRIRLDRIRELEAMLYAVGAGGVGKMEQPQVEQEPVAWQCRMKADWGRSNEWWPWQECSREKAEDYKRVPYLNNWQYESRPLYTHPQPPVVEQPTSTYQGGYLDGMAKGRRDAELDALETNPVAWLFRNANDHRIRFLEWTSTPTGYRGEWIKTPLYTRPQPLAHKIGGEV